MLQLQLVYLCTSAAHTQRGSERAVVGQCTSAARIQRGSERSVVGECTSAAHIQRGSERSVVGKCAQHHVSRASEACAFGSEWEHANRRFDFRAP